MLKLYDTFFYTADAAIIIKINESMTNNLDQQYFFFYKIKHIFLKLKS